MLLQVVTDALAARRVAKTDRAAAALAMTYARDLDGHEPCEHCSCAGGRGDLAKIGPALLAVLEALQMSPRSRAAVRKAGSGERPPATTALDQLAGRRARKRDAPSVDSGRP